MLGDWKDEIDVCDMSWSRQEESRRNNNIIRYGCTSSTGRLIHDFPSITEASTGRMKLLAWLRLAGCTHEQGGYEDTINEWTGN